MPAYSGETPTKASDDSYDYEFVGWTPEIDKVTGDIIYKAPFKAIEKDLPAPEPETKPTPATEIDAKIMPKLGDDSVMLYGFAVMAMICAGAVTVISARKREER